jgi:hypothetical protein
MSLDSQYSNLVKMHNIVQDQLKDLKEKADGIKEDIAKLMHQDKINEKLVDVDSIKYRVFYQGRTNKKVDYNNLYETVGPHKYKEIVTESQSEFLSIRKAPLHAQDKLTHNAPNGNKGSKKTLEPPVGSLA